MQNIENKRNIFCYNPYIRMKGSYCEYLKILTSQALKVFRSQKRCSQHNQEAVATMFSVP